MTRVLDATRPLAIVLFWTCLAGASVAAPDEPRLEVSANGAVVDLQVQATPRRSVIERLFAGRDVVFEWRDAAFADEPVSGLFRGTLTSVTRQLLGESNYVMRYVAGEGDQRRPSRLVIMGKAKSGDRGRQPTVADNPARASAKPDRMPVSAPGPADVNDQPRPRPTEDTPTRVAAGPDLTGSVAQNTALPQLSPPKPDPNAPVPTIGAIDPNGPVPIPQPSTSGDSVPLPMPVITSGAPAVVPMPGSMPSHIAIPMPKPQQPPK